MRLTHYSCHAGNTIYAAITAVIAANIVLVAYIITAAAEERKTSVTKTASTESKKEK